MAFKDYARSIPRAYPEKLSEKPKPKKKFYKYSVTSTLRDSVGRFEIVEESVLNRPGYSRCISHDPVYTSNPYTLARRFLVELPE